MKPVTQRTLRQVLVMAVACLLLAGRAEAKDYRAACRDAAKTLARQIAKKMPGEVVIAPADLEDLYSSKTKLGRFLSERIADEFVKLEDVNFTIAGVADTRAILDEYKRVEQGLVDPKSAGQLGEFRGANLVMVGRVEALDDSIVMTVRVLSTQRGTVVASATESFERTQDLERWAKGSVGGRTGRDSFNERSADPDASGSPAYPVKMPKSFFSIGPEAGSHWYDASRLNFASQSAALVSLVKSRGWYSATESHSAEALSAYYGVFAQYTRGRGSIGVGYRYFDLGSGTITVKDEHYPYWTKLTDSVQQSFTSPYITVGATNGVWSLNVETGTTLLSWNENYEWAGYGSSNTYFNFRRKLGASSSGMWYALTGAADLRFTRNFSLNLSLGYKLNRFDAIVVDSAESNFNTYRVGDTLKSRNNENYAINLNSSFGSMKLLFVF